MTIDHSHVLGQKWFSLQGGDCSFSGWSAVSRLTCLPSARQAHLHRRSQGRVLLRQRWDLQLPPGESHPTPVLWSQVPGASQRPGAWPLLYVFWFPAQRMWACDTVLIATLGLVCSRKSFPDPPASHSAVFPGPFWVPPCHTEHVMVKWAIPESPQGAVGKLLVSQDCVSLSCAHDQLSARLTVCPPPV